MQVYHPLVLNGEPAESSEDEEIVNAAGRDVGTNGYDIVVAIQEAENRQLPESQRRNENPSSRYRLCLG